MTLKTPLIKLDPNQGASLFWGLLSAFFFTASGFLLWQLEQSEYSANTLRDQVTLLNNRLRDTKTESDRLENAMHEKEEQLKNQEAVLKQEEQKLLDRENGGSPNPTPNPNSTTPASAQPDAPLDAKQLQVLKTFAQSSRKIAKDCSGELLLIAGRPVLRIPNAKWFSPGESTLLPAAKDALTKLTGALVGQMDHSELRISLFCDKLGEGSSEKNKNDPLTLTGSRALAIQHFLHEQTDLPLSHILCLPLGDQNPLPSKDAFNRRTEISVVPTAPSLPANALPPLTLLSADSDSKPTSGTQTPNTTLEPPADAPTKP